MITVLRIGHRPERDKRITTHVALTARAFGADKIIISEKDSKLAEGVRSVVERFGGNFEIETGLSWKTIIKNWRGHSVHLTMYGQRLEAALPKMPTLTDMLVVVGAEKVPRELYDMVDFNVSIGNQPHSEVAALAVFLDRFKPADLYRDTGGQMTIVPSADGKNVISEQEAGPDG
jgi:tRNA (cytidine56-2'-O)-methyltransferase